MKTNITYDIQKQLLNQTKRKFSLKYIDAYIIPLIKYIVYSNKKKFLISGSQGIGKTTLVSILKNNIIKYYKKKVLTLNLDDYYLSKKERIKLSKTKHPLFITRGVPGTHNIKKLRKNINDFDKSKYPITIPIFDKLKDDVSSKFRQEIGINNILLLEGWCCGCPPIKKIFLNKNINKIEQEEDKKNIWRSYYNNKLKNEYKDMFQTFDKTIFLKAPSFKYVLNWRSKQERMNKSVDRRKRKMNNKEMLNFISHYEKITKWMFRELSKNADVVLRINTKQEIIKSKFN
jgi:D-glycerate 3-kinase